MINRLRKEGLFIAFMSLFASIAINAQTVGSVYRIVSSNTGKAVTNNGNINADAQVVMGEYKADDKNQMWALISDGSEGNYGLYNIGSRKSIDMALESGNPGRLLQWKPNLNNQNQVFNIHSPGIAGSAIQLLCSAKPNLAVTEYSNGDLWMKDELTNTSTYFELQEVVSAEENTIPLPYQTYLIQSVNTQYVLSNGGSNENNALIIAEQPKDGAYGQMWKLSIPMYQSGGTTWYQLYNSSCGKCIDAALDNKRVLLQWTQDTNERNPNWNQMFDILEVEGMEDVYQLKVGQGTSNCYVAINSTHEVYISTDASSSDTYFSFKMVKSEHLPQGLPWQDEKVFEQNKE